MSKARDIADVLVSPDFTGTATANGLTATSTTTSGNLRVQNSASGAGASDGVLLQSNSNAAYLWNYESGDMIFATANAEAMRLSSGKVGIGTSSPAALLTVTASDGVAADQYVAKLTNSEATAGQNYGLYVAGGSNSSDQAFTVRNYNNTANYLTVRGDGNVGIGTTAINAGDGNTTTGISLTADGRLYASAANDHNFNRNSDGQLIAWRNAGVKVGSISITGSATSYNTSSDYRLKTDVQPMTGATATFMQLKPCNFEWIADGTRTDGFLAHELQGVIPAAATGSKDAMMDEEYEVTPAVLDDEGVETTPAVMATRSVPDMQGIDQAKVVPLLVATIQELIARVEALEAVG